MAKVRYSEEMLKFIDAIAEELIINDAVEYNQQGHLKVEPYNHGHTLKVLDLALKRASLEMLSIPEVVRMKEAHPTHVNVQDAPHYETVWADPYHAKIRQRVKEIVRERSVQVRVHLTYAQKKRLEFGKKTEEFRSKLSPELLKEFNELMLLNGY